MISLADGHTFAYEMIGEFRSVGEWIHPRRTVGSFELIAVLEGTVCIAEEERYYALQKNDLLLLEPQREHFGWRSTAAPVAFYWLHFVTDLPITVKHCSGADVYELRRALRQLLHITNTPGYPPSAADAAAYLIFEEIARLPQGKEDASQALAARIIEYIRSSSVATLSVTDISTGLGYTPDHIGRAFKKSRGLSLQSHLTAQRLQQIRDRLLTTDRSVKQIAADLGYPDAERMIKFFTYHEQIGPAAFRRRYGNTHINHA